ERLVGVLEEPVRPQPHLAEQEVRDPVGRVEQPVEDDARGNGRGRDGDEDGRPVEAREPDRPVEEQRHPERGAHRDPREDERVDDRPPDRVAEDGVMDELAVVGGADPCRRGQQVVVLERKQERPPDGDDPEDAAEHHGREDEEPPGRVLRSQEPSGHDPCARIWSTCWAAWSRAAFGSAFPSSTAWMAWPIAWEISL